MLPLLPLLIVIGGCGNRAADRARVQLAQLNVPYTESSFIDGAREGNAGVVELFLDAGMDTEVKTREGQTPLMAAALADRIEVVKKLLDRSANVNAKDKFEGTALMTAAWKGSDEVVALLLAHGAESNAKAANGMTALAFAVWENHVDAAKSLIGKGADIESRDGNRWTPDSRGPKGHLTPSICFSEELMPTRNPKPVTPLMCSGSRTPQVAVALLNAGAEINAADREGRSG
jgi:hypothetical protein